MAEKSVDDFANSEPKTILRIDALLSLREGLEDMAVSGPRLDTANTILAYIDKKLRDD